MPAGYIEYELDEEYPFLLRRPKQGNPYGEVYGRLDIAVFGKATIAFDDADDWYVDTLDINANNGKLRDESESWTERVDGALFKAVKDYLNTMRADEIAEKIRESIEDTREAAE